MSAKTINPTTGELLFEVPYITKEELEQKIQKASNAFNSWKNTSFEERGNLMKNLVNLMSERKEELAKLDTMEMGMLYTDAQGDVSKSMSNVLYFAENAPKMLESKRFEEGGIKGRIEYQPMGVLYCVAPWNYPVNQVLRSTIPNLMAGNVVMVKHASNVPQVAIALEKLFLDAGFPKGVYTNLLIPASFSEYIISHKVIVGTTITGGDKAGRTIGELAGKNLKPSVLELGGNDPFIALDTNDVEKTVKFALTGRLSNCGQKCNSSKRFIVIESIYDEFVKGFAEGMKNTVVGDPMETTTKIGPLAKEEAIADIDSMIKGSLELGAKLACGGKRIDRKGYFYEPTVVYDVKPGMPVFDEEVFGPVAAVIKAKDINDVISLANNSKYGLGCSIFGDNIEDMNYIASKVEVSNIGINKIVTSYPFLPYGGIKNTGYGKELGERGIKTFCNEKVIVEG
nr:aldehyde dehydrogenase family protein [Candidatus Gracilibacteria bacterium]